MTASTRTLVVLTPSFDNSLRNSKQRIVQRPAHFHVQIQLSPLSHSSPTISTTTTPSDHCNLALTHIIRTLNTRSSWHATIIVFLLFTLSQIIPSLDAIHDFDPLEATNHVSLPHRRDNRSPSRGTTSWLSCVFVEPFSFPSITSALDNPPVQPF